MFICLFCRRLNVCRQRQLQSPIGHPETIKSDDTQRPIWSSARFVKGTMFVDRDYFSLPFAIQGQSSPMARGDKLWSSTTFAIQRQSSLMTRRDQRGHLLFPSKTQCLSTETTEVSPFTIQRRSNPIACRDYNGRSLSLFRHYQSPLSSRDKQVRWYAGTMMVVRF